MDSKYTALLSEFRRMKENLEKITGGSSAKGLENKIVFAACENLMETLDNTIWRIEHYSKPVKEGTLRRMENDKFELVDRNGRQITYFSCGGSIECFVKFDDEEKEWHAGRVEHKSSDDYEGYYFFNRDAGFPFLHDGMRARIRTSY